MRGTVNYSSTAPVLRMIMAQTLLNILSGCSPRAANGHATAPPSYVMNSRRFIRSPRRRAAGSYRARRDLSRRTSATSLAPKRRKEMDRRHHQRFGTAMGLSEDEGRSSSAATRQTRVVGSDGRSLVRVALFSTDSAKDRTVANIRRLAAFLQPLGHVTTDRQIRQMVRRPRRAPQFNRSLPCPLAIWLALRRGRLGGHLAIKPVEKILFDDRKLRAADRIDVVISNNMEFARLKRLANDRRSSFAAYFKALANYRDGFPKRQQWLPVTLFSLLMSNYRKAR